MERLPASQPSSLAEIIPVVRQLPAVDKLRLIRILAEELDSGEDIAPFTLGKTYHIATPYGNFGVAESLANAMSSPSDDDH